MSDPRLLDLQSSDRALIIEAAKSLAEDHSTTDALVTLLATEHRVENRVGILYALTWHGRPDLWNQMLSLVADERENPRVRGQAAEFIAYQFHAHTPGSEPFDAALRVLAKTSNDASPEVRYCTAFALGAVVDPVVIPLLEAMAGDETPVEGWPGTVGWKARDQLGDVRWALAQRDKNLPDSSEK